MSHNLKRGMKLEDRDNNSPGGQDEIDSDEGFRAVDRYHRYRRGFAIAGKWVGSRTRTRARPEHEIWQVRQWT